MLFRPLVLAAVTSSFVIIPKISSYDENIFNALPIEEYDTPVSFRIPDSAFKKSVVIPCSDCGGRDVSLELDFTIKDETKLLLNGFELYPHADPWSGDLRATVFKGHRGSKEKKLGYSLAVYLKESAKDDNLELIGVELRVIEVGSQFVEGVPPVNVDLIKAPGGSIMMTAASFDLPEPPACTSLWCRVRHMGSNLLKALQLLKGCGKHHDQSQSHKYEVDLSALPDEYEIELPDEFEVDIDDVHGFADPSMSDLKDWRHLAKSIAGHIVIPIIMGVTAGVAVAL